MSRLVKNLLYEEDLVEQIRKTRVVDINYGWKFKSKEVSFIEISCGEFKLRVNSLDILDSNSAYDVLVREARALSECFNGNLKFRAYYCGRQYKAFSLQ